MSELTEVLSAIKKTGGLRVKINKELGLDKRLSNSIQPDDMYFYEYKKPDLESVSYLILHGKCIEAGQKQLKEWGYEFVQTRHTQKKQVEYSGTRCAHCNEQMDAKAYAKYKAEATKRAAKRLEEYLEEKAIREEWEEEQILLGKM